MATQFETPSGIEKEEGEPIIWGEESETAGQETPQAVQDGRVETETDDETLTVEGPPQGPPEAHPETPPEPEPESEAESEPELEFGDVAEARVRRRGERARSA